MLEAIIESIQVKRISPSSAEIYRAFHFLPLLQVSCDPNVSDEDLTAWVASEYQEQIITALQRTGLFIV